MVDVEGEFLCSCCGKTYVNLTTNFPKTQSELWAGRKYYLPICCECVDKLYDHYVNAYGGDEYMAIRRMCMLFDVYYNKDIVEQSLKVAKTKSLFSAYISRTNLSQYRDKTYDTTLDEEKYLELVKKENIKESGGLTDEIISRWGVGVFGEEEYMLLEEHYRLLKKNNPNIDNNQEIFVKDLCNIHLMKVQAAKERRLDDYLKASEQYSKIFAKTGLKTVEEKDSSNNDTLGVTLAVISQYTPEEFYKDKTLFEDYDKLGEYYDRHILRPMKNLMTGSNVRDPEFFVPEDDDGVEVEED